MKTASDMRAAISYENGGLRVWRAYVVGSGKFYSAVMLARFRTPQGPTELVTLEPFSLPQAGTYQQHPEPASATTEPGPLKEFLSLHRQDTKVRCSPVKKKDASRGSSHSSPSKSTWMSGNTW